MEREILPVGTVKFGRRFLAGVAYPFWPVSLVIVFSDLRKEQFLRYHGYQALFFGLCATVLYVVGGMLLPMIPLCGNLLCRFLAVFLTAGAVFLSFRCFQGDYFKVPLIYALARGNMLDL